MQTFFQDNNSDELILLFNGWGMDEKPFLPLTSSRDILFVSDYSNFDFSPNIDFSDYKKIFLITFSAGTFMTAFLKDNLSCPAFIHPAGYPAAGMDLALLRSDLKNCKKLSFFEFFRVLYCDKFKCFFITKNPLLDYNLMR